MDAPFDCLIYNNGMKLQRWLVLAITFFLFACQPTTPPTATIIDNGQVNTLQTEERVPSALLAQAGITPNPNDRILFRGQTIAPDEPVTDKPITIQIRRAVDLTLDTPDGQSQVQSSAFTVGEVLAEASYWLRDEDEIAPPINSPITDGMLITVSSPRALTVSVDGKVAEIKIFRADSWRGIG